MVLQQVYNYLLYLVSGLVVTGAFIAVYIHITPLSEFRLIREGCAAAALSLGGAAIGFSLTVAASILHSDSIHIFVFWSACAAVIQLLTYFVCSRIIPESGSALEDNNIAVGGLFGAAALTVGILNAACLS